jgi:CRP-like cAMP-binding protein
MSPGRKLFSIYIAALLPMTLQIDKYHFINSGAFENIPLKDRQKLLQPAVRFRAKKGKVIYREGTFPKGIYILRRGKVKIYQTNRDAREQIVYIYTKGEFFGFRPLICDEAHPVSAAALEDCSYDFIPANHFLKCMKSSFDLMNSLLVSLSHEFTVWVNNITVFAQHPVRARVALGLLVLQEKYKSKGKSGEVNLSRTDLASYLGTVKETLVRVLQEFKKKNLVETQGSKIRILNYEELKEIANLY